jgi:hypothetical protein
MGGGGGTSMTANAGASESPPAAAGFGGMRANAAGGAGANAAGGAGASSTASAGASGTPTSGMDPSSGGMADNPPLVVGPVETWGGKPLDMVPFATSGTRLLAVGYADDGAAFFDTMRDLALGTDCAFEQNDAGDWVCSPKDKEPLVYLDAACTDPAVEVPAFTTPTGEVFGFSDGSPSGGGGSDTVLVPKHAPVYRVGDELFASDGVSTFAEDVMSIYARQSTQCNGPLLADRHVVVNPPSLFRAKPVDDSELVKATLRDIPLNDGLTLERLVTDDGAQLSGHVKLAGRQCELEADGRAVPEPVAERQEFADADCTEEAFHLTTAPDAGTTIYGVVPSSDGTNAVYELTPTTTIYAQRTRTDVMIVNGQQMAVVTVIGCDSVDVSTASSIYYRRAKDVTEQLPKLDTVQLGTAQVFPNWFVGVVAANGSRIQVQIHSPDQSWVRPNVGVSNGSVCAVYDDRFKDQCLVLEGLPNIAVTEVTL